MIRIDPENNEIRALFALADFSGHHVLEIGCGDGRLTWRYADKAARLTAIDPNGDRIARAKENTPKELVGGVKFQHISFEEFTSSSKSSIFDSAIFSWSF